MKRLLVAAAVAFLSMSAYAAEVDMLSGGIGEGEAAYMDRVSGQYDLKLVFTDQSGGYLPDVQFTIKDAKGNDVTSGMADGPILLVRLPQGRYKITATSDNATHTQSVNVNANGLKTYQFRFPAV